ncbi:DUF4349 domain-containing protein [Gilvimarinus sp. F26214L]|uniref:DUF4349 domain-containing protein n=1 Tax=Gilvimarinus sp. DZF01 TaxID=3461371 RepID=UPI00404542E6
MKKIIAFVFVPLAALLLTACSDDPRVSPAPVGDAAPSFAGRAMGERSVAADRMTAQKASNPYLALEHYFRVRLAEDLIRSRYEATVERCKEDFFGCTLVDASLHEDRYALSANIQVRIANPGVEGLMETASEGGEIASQNSRAEDLTEVVTDTEKRLEMLKSYRQRLEALESRAADDIESLIKVSSELSRVQSDIERIEAQRKNLQKRLDLDLLNIHFYTETEDQVFTPVRQSLERFVYNLFVGVSGIITGVARALPWVVALLLLGTLLRWIWRRRSRR